MFVLSLPLTLLTELYVLTLTPCGQWGPEITNDPELRDRAHFKPFALGGTSNHNDNDNPKYWTPDSLMSLNCAHVIFSSSPPFYR